MLMKVDLTKMTEHKADQVECWQFFSTSFQEGGGIL